MTVYATNVSTIQGVIKINSGKDYIIPPDVIDYVIGEIELSQIAYKSVYILVNDTESSFVDRAAPEETYYLFRFKGYIQYSTDFPLPSEVSKGDTYEITNDNVVDSSASRTNTGQVFAKGDRIYWNDAGNWSRDESLTAAMEKFRWVSPVLDVLTAPPGGEVVGDRYRIDATTATGDWVGKENHIAEFTVIGWVYTEPEPNMSYILATDDSGYTYDDLTSQWVLFAGSANLLTGPGLKKPVPDKIELDIYDNSLEFVGVGDAAKVRVGVVDGGTF